MVTPDSNNANLCMSFIFEVQCFSSDQVAVIISKRIVKTIIVEKSRNLKF